MRQGFQYWSVGGKDGVPFDLLITRIGQEFIKLNGCDELLVEVQVPQEGLVRKCGCFNSKPWILPPLINSWIISIHVCVYRAINMNPIIDSEWVGAGPSLNRLGLVSRRLCAQASRVIM